MFKTWTKLTVGGASGKTNSATQRPHLKDANRIATDARSCFLASQPVRTVNDEKFSVTYIRGEAARSRMAVGLFDTARIEEVMSKLHLLFNAAVFVVNYDAIREGAKEDMTMLFALPLKFQALAMFQDLWWGGDQALDFRLVLAYGCVPRLETQWHKVGLEQHRRDMAYIGHDWGRSKKTREQRIVYRGKVLSASDYCVSCENNVGYATGRCAFGMFNCILGSAHEPGMVTASEPRFDEFFGPSAYRTSKLCLARPRGAAADASQLIVGDGPRKVGRDLRKETATRIKRRNDKSLRELVCPKCLFGGERYGCKNRIGPSSCQGPVRLEDIAKYIGHENIPNWVLHTFMLSGREVDVQKFGHPYSSICVVSKAVIPSGRTVRGSVRPGQVKLFDSAGSALTRTVPYRDLCKALGEPALGAKCRRALIEKYPVLQDMDPITWLAIAMEARINHITYTTYEVKPDSLVGCRPTTRLDNCGLLETEQFDLQHLGTPAQWEAEASMSAKRLSENHKICAEALKRSKFVSSSVKGLRKSRGADDA